jgi:hypothetical protein
MVGPVVVPEMSLINPYVNPVSPNEIQWTRSVGPWEEREDTSGSRDSNSAFPPYWQGAGTASPKQRFLQSKCDW